MKVRYSVKKLAALFLVAGLSASPAAAQTGASVGATKMTSVSEKLLTGVLSKIQKSVVKVKASGEFCCLGTVVEADGMVLTKLSELRGESLTCELPDGRTPNAKIVARNEPYDLALLKVEVDDLTPVEWTLSASAAVGSWVASVGADKDKPAAIGVVGVAARKVRASLRDSVFVPRANGGFLGIQMDVPENGAPGVLVTKVTAGSPAEKAGLKAGDVVVGINGIIIAHVEQFRETIANYDPNAKVKIKIKRQAEELEKEVTLAKRPADLNTPDRSDFQNRMGSTLSNRRNGFPTILQHDGVIKPTDCGAPLVDLDGHVVGINIARAGRTESYCIPSESVLPVLADMLAGHNVNRVVVSPYVTAAQEEELKSQIKAAEERVKAAKLELGDLENTKANIDSEKKRLAGSRAAEKEELNRLKKIETMEELPKPAPPSAKKS